MFNKAITSLQHEYGITTIDDWKDVRPSWILEQPGVGPTTLDHIRMYLAMRGVTLCDDMTPEHWKENLGEIRIAKMLTLDELNVSVPFSVVVDSREQHPFTFTGITADASEISSDHKELIKEEEIKPSDIKLLVPKIFRSLGNGQGDYSIDGFEGRCNIERKSMEDAHGTILGWGRRRERFEEELENLSAMDCAAVVVECTFERLLKESPCKGKKTADENRKILFRQTLSWQQDYRVPWVFCGSRAMAEVATFRILQRYWRKQKEKRPNKEIDEAIASL